MKIRNVCLALIMAVAFATPAAAQTPVLLYFVIIAGEQPGAGTVVEDVQLSGALQRDCVLDRRLDPICSELVELAGLSFAEASATAHRLGAELTRTVHVAAGAADMNADGIDDLGLWVPGTQLDPLPLPIDALLYHVSPGSKTVAETRTSRTLSASTYPTLNEKSDVMSVQKLLVDRDPRATRNRRGTRSLDERGIGTSSIDPTASRIGFVYQIEGSPR